MVIAPKNAHGPGMLLMLTAVSAWILSIILIPNSRSGDRQVTLVSRVTGQVPYQDFTCLVTAFIRTWRLAPNC
jgi:hypothetical protein